jgi:preprotein translocase subunit YajC
MLPVRSARRTKGTPVIAVSSLLAQSSSGAQQGGGLLGLLFPLVLLGGVFYFLLLRPQRAQRQRQQQLQSALDVGDEVVTIAGIFGTITDIDEDDDSVTVEIAPGTRVRMVRRAISQRLTEDEPGDEDEQDDDVGNGAHGQAGDDTDEEAGDRP